MAKKKLTVDEVLATPAPAVEAVAPQEPVNTSVTTEEADLSGVDDATNRIIQGMKDEGLTYAQAYQKYYPKPVMNTPAIDSTRKLQKAALIADMIRLATEGVGAFAGSNISRRDSSQAQSALAQRLANEYNQYNKNLQEWQTKGVDAAMKDVQLRSDLYGRMLSNAPKKRTTVQDNAWDKEKFSKQQAQTKEIADENREAANQRSKNSIAAANTRAAATRDNSKKDNYVSVVFADNSGSASIPKDKEKSFYNAAYQAMLNDPAFAQAGNRDAKEIERINNDFSFEGKSAKIKVYVDQYIHESPKALELLKSNAVEFNRKPAQSGNAAPWLKKTNTNKAPWVIR